MTKNSKIKATIIYAVFVLLMLSVFVNAEDADTPTTAIDETQISETADAASNTASDLYESTIEDEAVPDSVVDQEMTLTQVNDGIGTRTVDRLKYAFTFNKEKKAELSLDIAKRKLLLANKMSEKNNPQAMQNAQEQYQKWMLRAQGAISGLPQETKIDAAAKIQNKIEMNQKIVDRIRAGIDGSSITQEQKAAILARLGQAKDNAEKAKEIAEKRIDLIEQRMAQVEKLTPEQIEAKRIEARLGNSTGNGAGKIAMLEAFIRIAEKDIVKAKEIVSNLPNATAEQTAKANEIIASAEDYLAKAKTAKDEGKYEEAKENALKARKTVMNAYIRSRYNALSNDAKERMRNLSPEQVEKARTRMNEDLRARMQARMQNGTQKMPNRTDGKVCPQIVVSAFDPVSKACEKFPTPCDVPAGWRKIPTCTNTIANTIQEVTPEEAQQAEQMRQGADTGTAAQ